jgi:hypothetical protein
VLYLECIDVSLSTRFGLGFESQDYHSTNAAVTRHVSFRKKMSQICAMIYSLVGKVAIGMTWKACSAYIDPTCFSINANLRHNYHEGQVKLR